MELGNFRLGGWAWPLPRSHDHGLDCLGFRPAVKRSVLILRASAGEGQGLGEVGTAVWCKSESSQLSRTWGFLWGDEEYRGLLLLCIIIGLNVH